MKDVELFSTLLSLTAPWELKKTVRYSRKKITLSIEYVEKQKFCVLFAQNPVLFMIEEIQRNEDI